MENNTKGWASITSSVTTELKLLALALLIVGDLFAVAIGRPGVEPALLIKAFSCIVLLVILIAGALLFYRARSTYIEKLAQNKTFAQCLGEEVFKGYNYYIIQADRQEAHNTAHDLLMSSKFFVSAAERDFVKNLAEMVKDNAKKDKTGPKEAAGDESAGFV